MNGEPEGWQPAAQPQEPEGWQPTAPEPTTQAPQPEPEGWKAAEPVKQTADPDLAYATRGFLERMKAGWEAGFGKEPIGMSTETMLKYPMWQPWQPLVAGAEATMRAVPGVLGAGAGAVSAAAEATGITNKAEADRLQRDLTIMGQGALIEPGMGLAATTEAARHLPQVLRKQGGTAGSEAAAGTAQGPKPTASVPVSTEADKPLQNAAVRAPTPGPENYGKTAAPTGEAGVSVSDVDPTVRAAAEVKLAPPDLEAKIGAATEGQPAAPQPPAVPPGLADVRQRIQAIQNRGTEGPTEPVRPAAAAPPGPQAAAAAIRRGGGDERIAQELEQRAAPAGGGAGAPPPEPPSEMPTPTGGGRPQPPLPPPPEPPAPSFFQNARQKVSDYFGNIWRDVQMGVAPMAAGTPQARAIAKDFANSLRKNLYDWSRRDSALERQFTPEQRKTMWEAADEESVLRQQGQDSAGRGISVLPRDQQAAVMELQEPARAVWERAKDLGMVEGEGLPFYTPRMIVGLADALKQEGNAFSLDPIGMNLRVTTPQMRQRKYLTAAETEAAAKEKFGPKAEIARDIRSLPLAIGKLEDAVAGRELINQIKQAGKATGNEVIAEGNKPGPNWFTIDHPAFRTWRPRMEEVDGKWQPKLDADGNKIFEQVPIFVRGDFEGPLRSVLSQKSSAPVKAMMDLKGKTMGLIMNSPMIHNMVEWGRALPAMPGKVLTGKIYFEGNAAKKDIGTMHEAIDAGLVPIGKRFFNQDITSIMEQPNLTPGRSWTSQVLGFAPGLFDPKAGAAVRRAVDKAGDFWHNTLLWDRIGDLQMGLYTNMRDSMLDKGVDRQTAARVAAHWANRYAGALPQEAMSQAARTTANFMLFSRSFTLGNLGAMKDALTGLPRDVLAQIERDAGFAPGSIERASATGPAVQFAKSMARRKAMMIVGLDMALSYIGNSLLQSGVNVLAGDNSLSDEMRGYADRFGRALKEFDPKDLAYPPLAAHKLVTALSATGENEPGKQDRVLIGHDKDGTAIYARVPTGKIGEEFTGYLTGPIDMLKRKLGTVARPVWQIISNDAGFGYKIYDPNADSAGKYADNIGKIVTHLLVGQTPAQQIKAAGELVRGEGDTKVAAAQTFAPFLGVTVSHGAPGGEAVGEMYRMREDQKYKMQQELPDLRKQVQRGDTAGARDRMNELNVPSGLQRYYMRVWTNPASRLGGRTLRDVRRGATPEQRDRLERAIERQRGAQ